MRRELDEQVAAKRLAKEAEKERQRRLDAEDEARVLREQRQLARRSANEERTAGGFNAQRERLPPSGEAHALDSQGTRGESDAAARAKAAAQWVAGAAPAPNTQLAMYDPAAAAAYADDGGGAPRGVNPPPGRNLGVPHLLQRAGPVGGDLGFPMGGAPMALQQRLRAPSALHALGDMRTELVAEHVALTRVLGGGVTSAQAAGLASELVQEDTTVLPEVYVPGVHAALPWEGGEGGVGKALAGRRAEREAEMPGVESALVRPPQNEGGFYGAPGGGGVDALERWMSQFEAIDRKAKADMMRNFARR